MDSNTQASSDRDERTFCAPSQANASDAPSTMLPLTNHTQNQSRPALARISNQHPVPGNHVPSFAFAGPSMAFGRNSQNFAGQRPDPENVSYRAAPSMRSGPGGDFQNSQPPQSSFPPSENYCLKGIPGIDCACNACFTVSAPTEELPFGHSPHTAHGSLMHGNQSTGIDSSHLTWQSVPTRNTQLHTNQSPYASYCSNTNPRQNPLHSSSYFSTSGPNGNLNFTNSSALSNPYSQFSNSYIDRGPAFQAQPIHTASTTVHDENTTQGHGNKKIPSPVKRRRQRRSKHNPTELPHKVDKLANLDHERFLKVQNHFHIEFGDNPLPPNAEKENFSKFLKLSLPQLDSCIRVRAVVMPMLIGLSSAVREVDMPLELATQWFSIVHSQQSSKKDIQDSAYVSNLNTAQPAPNSKKRKRPTAAGPYQCTYICTSGDYCLQSTSNLTDWIRHEEIHWPHKRWHCVIEDCESEISCLVCREPIPLVNQSSPKSHRDCIGKIDRNGHTFHRKDKLSEHVRNVHHYNANVEEWYEIVHSDWKRQCGFCGKRFQDWNRRCEHVGPHFEEGKKMVPDWKDPWPASEDNISQPPSDDEDEDDDDDDDDGRDDNYNDDPHDNDGKYEDDEDLYSASPERRHNCDTPAGNHTPSSQSGNVQNHSGIPPVSSYAAFNTESTRHQQTLTPNSSLPASETPEHCQEPFQFIKRLGHGSFGVVDQVEHCVTKKVFARKSVREITPRSALTMSQARKELLALRTLKHPHIINIVASYSIGNTFAMIMTPVAEYNLHQFMREDASLPLIQASHLSRWMGCLTSAVAYIHKQSWNHFDIKPMNILVSGGDVVISDFGGAFLTTGKRSTHRSCAVTPMYCAPELASPVASDLVPGACDIYSLGCVFLEMATVIHRQDLDTFESFRKFDSRDGTYHNNIWKSSTWIDLLREIDGRFGIRHEDFLDVIGKMVSGDVARRPSAERIWEMFRLYSNKSQPLCKYGRLQFNDLKEGIDPMKLTQDWLRDCLENHIHCTKPIPTYFPPRILNVGLDSQMVHLESNGFQGSKPYVTLSHCWGSGDILKTTSENFSQMTTGIQISSLSDSFFNAVRITRALGFTYLWIDALCILQDSVEDWSFQCSQMHKVYSNSSLTICIASSETTQLKQPQISFSGHTAPESIPSCSACTNDYRIFQPLSTASMATMFLDSPWYKRAWVMQEVLLSGRVLYFSSSGMAWECGSTTSAEAITSRLRRNLKRLTKETAPSENHSLTATSEIHKYASSFRRSWRTIVEEYSKRELTYHQDKLPALAGVAAKFAEVTRQTYVAGLWAENLIHSLLWCRSFSSVPLARPTYRAPSWSWASVDGPITWHKSVVDLPDIPGTAVVDCSTTPKSTGFTYGGVSNGYLKINGMMRRGIVDPTRSKDVLDSNTKKSFAFPQWDTLGSLKRHRFTLSSKKEAIKHFWCLQIREGAGLILSEISEGQYERVGMFWISEKDISKPFAKSSWELKTVTIV